jgi:hypothetical protein
MQVYSVRDAKPDEQRELTRLCVRATMQAGYDEAFIDRAMPGLTVTLPPGAASRSPNRSPAKSLASCS